MDRKTFITEAHKLVLKIPMKERIDILLDAQEIAVECVRACVEELRCGPERRKALITRRRMRAYQRLIEKLLVECGFDMDNDIRMYIGPNRELIYIQD